MITFKKRRRIARGASICLLMATFGFAAQAHAEPLPSTRWEHDDGDAWFTQGDLADVNGDRTPDVIVAGGDRPIYWWALVPPGNPKAAVSQVKTNAETPAPRLVALDGADGTVLWSKAYGTNEALGKKTHFEFLDAAVSVDGPSGQRILVLRNSYDSANARSTGMVQHMTMYDAGKGKEIWDVSEKFPADVYSYKSLQSVEVGGMPGAVIATIRYDEEFHIKSSVELVAFPMRGGPKVIWDSGWIRGSEVVAAAAAEKSGTAVYLSEFVYTHNGDGSFTIEPGTLTALRIDDDGGSKKLWTAVESAGRTMAAVDGPEGSIVVGSGDLAARDVETGRVLWRNDIYLDWYFGGTLFATPVNGDRTRDFVISTPNGSTLYPGDFSSEIVALDGRSGEQLWKHTDPLAKFGPVAFAVGNVDGDEQEELVASMMGEDGFAFAGQYGDDPGLVAAYDLESGTPKCRFPTDRLAPVVLPEQADDVPGDEISVPTLGGIIYQFTKADPECGPLNSIP